MRKPLIALVILLFGGSALALLAQRRVPDLGRYRNVDIHLGAVSTDAAAAGCPMGGHPRLVCLAEALKAALPPDQRATVQRPYSIADARRWSNFPPVGYPDRVGPTLGDFTRAQLGLVKALLVAASGIARDEGYDELEQILNADDFLKANTRDNAGFSSGNYHLAFLGTPASTGTWQLYFGGHHTAVTNTYRDGRLVGATPSFRGVEPFTRFRHHGRENAPMAQEQAAFAAMLAALTPAQARRAALPEVFTDIVVGPQKDGAFPTVREGVRAGTLTAAQQALVLRAIETYVGDADPRGAGPIMDRYRAELADTFVAYSGTPALTAANDYVRVAGPSVWIEYSLQPGRSVPGVHPHSVWRDRRTDYGG